MNDAPKSESLKSVLDTLFEKERAAQAALLKDKKHLFTDASAPDQPIRICESINGHHQVYQVDVKSVQKYLDDIGAIVELFQKSVPSNSEIFPPEADLRFLEVWGDSSSPYLGDFPYTLQAKCQINFSHSKCKAPIELIFLSEFSTIDLSKSEFEMPFCIQISNEVKLDINANQAKRGHLLCASVSLVGVRIEREQQWLIAPVFPERHGIA